MIPLTSVLPTLICSQSSHTYAHTYAQPHAHPGGRLDRLYDSAIYNYHYDPYNALGQSWDAWYDFYGWESENCR